MTIPFECRITVPQGVLVSEVGLESVFLNLKSSNYFGLDEIGTRMWKVLTTSETIQMAYNALLNEFETSEAQLQSDLDELIQKLSANGLIEITKV